MKRFFQALIAVLLVAMLSASCLAAEPLSLRLHNVMLGEGGNLQIKIYCSADELAAGDFALTLDNNPVPVDNMESNGSSGRTSWFFVVDTGKVNTDVGTEPLRKLMPALLDKMGSDDNAAVITTGDKPREIELMKRDGANLSNWIEEELGRDAQAGSLDSALDSVFSFLKDGENLRENASIVVVTNGLADYTNAKRMEEEVAASGATLHVIAFAGKEEAGSGIMDELESLANASYGGLFFAPSGNAPETEDEKNIRDIVSGIEANRSKFYTLSANPVAAGVVGKELKLVLEKGNYIARAVYTLNDADVEILGSSVVAPTPTPTPVPDFWQKEIVLGLNGMEVCIIGGCLLLAILILILVIVKAGRRRRREEENMTSVPVSGPAVTSPVIGIVGGAATGGPPTSPVDYSAPRTMPVNGTEAVSPLRPLPRETEILVTLTQVGSRDEGVFSGVMRNQMIVGRDPSGAQLVLPSNDLKISGRHMLLRYEGGVMVAEDKSRNGTMVNDMRIYHPTRLHQQDVITLGTTRYRITWTIRQ